MRPFFCATFRKKSLTNISKICCSIYVFKLYHKTCEQFYRNFGIYEKSPNSFLPGLPHSIVNQFDFHNFLCLCLASVHLPYPFHLVSAFSFSVTPFCSASDRTISSMRFRAASSILAQYCLTYTQLWPHAFCFIFVFMLEAEKRSSWPLPPPAPDRPPCPPASWADPPETLCHRAWHTWQYACGSRP